jgi:hypothetical protein
MKAIFAPEFFASLPDDMTQEELDELINNIIKMVEEGTLEEHSIPLSDEEYEDFISSLKELPERH